MELTRGEVVLVTLPGDYVVVQSDLFAPDFASVSICPITKFPRQR